MKKSNGVVIKLKFAQKGVRLTFAAKDQQLNKLIRIAPDIVS